MLADRGPRVVATPVGIEPDRLSFAPVSRRSMLGGCLAAASIGLVSCAKPVGPPPPPPPAKLTLRIRAADAVNPSVSGRPSPLVLRIYELKSDTAFASSDFMTLYQNDRSALASDMLQRDEFSLRPGEERVIERLLAPDTQVVAFMGAFRDLERAQWRVTRAVKRSAVHQWTLMAEERALRLSGTP